MENGTRLLIVASVACAVLFAAALAWYLIPKVDGVAPKPVATAADTDPAVPQAILDLVPAAYAEQVASQEMMGLLASGGISAVSFGSPSLDASGGTIPLSVTMRDGAAVSGTARLASVDGTMVVVGAERSGAAPAAGALAVVPSEEASAVAGSLSAQLRASGSPAYAALMSGTLGEVALGSPVQGSGTVTIPGTANGKRVDIVLVRSSGGTVIFAGVR